MTNRRKIFRTSLLSRISGVGLYVNRNRPKNYIDFTVYQYINNKEIDGYLYY